MGSKKDNGLLVFAIIALGFIMYVVVANYTGNGKTFGINTYYKTQDTTTKNDNDGTSYARLTSNSRLGCPGEDNTKPKGTEILVSGVTGTGNKYTISRLPFTRETIDFKYQAVTSDTVSDLLFTDVKEGTLEQIWSGASTPIGSSYYEILAPFSFGYDNSNLDISQDVIQITNISGTCRMVISKPANWFCAGEYGTTTVYSNKGDSVEWSEHGNHHLSKIGAGSKIVSRGAPGDLVGYGDADTVITFYAVYNGNWIKVPLITLLKEERIKAPK